MSEPECKAKLEWMEDDPGRKFARYRFAVTDMRFSCACHFVLTCVNSTSSTRVESEGSVFMLAVRWTDARTRERTGSVSRTDTWRRRHRGSQCWCATNGRSCRRANHTTIGGLARGLPALGVHPRTPVVVAGLGDEGVVAQDVLVDAGELGVQFPRREDRLA